MGGGHRTICRRARGAGGGTRSLVVLASLLAPRVLWALCLRSYLLCLLLWHKGPKLLLSLGLHLLLRRCCPSCLSYQGFRP